eukprot:scaffold7979_cov417-Prasinococcus_capsulatus_cf.AAC.16
MGFIVEHAGGIASDGNTPMLDIEPQEVHQKLPVFVGSKDDMNELLSYSNAVAGYGIRQEVNPGYEV